MTPEQFAYWLQGRAELCKEPPNAEEWQIIKDHLALVFTKVTPTYAPYQAPFVQPQVVPTPPWEITCMGKSYVADDKTFFVDFNSLPRYSI